MSHRNHEDCDHNSDGGIIGCAFMIGIGIIALPLVGLYLLLTGKNSDNKVLGLILLIIGIIIWIMVAAQR